MNSGNGEPQLNAVKTVEDAIAQAHLAGLSEVEIWSQADLKHYVARGTWWHSSNRKTIWSATGATVEEALFGLTAYLTEVENV